MTEILSNSVSVMHASRFKEPKITSSNMQDQTFLWNHFMTMPILIKWITALCIVMHNKVLETLKLILARAYLIFHIKVGQESRTAFINFGWYLTKFGRCVVTEITADTTFFGTSQIGSIN